MNYGTCISDGPCGGDSSLSTSLEKRHEEKWYKPVCLPKLSITCVVLFGKRLHSEHKPIRQHYIRDKLDSENLNDLSIW